MSRGLGRVEREIIRQLPEMSFISGVDDLASYLEHETVLGWHGLTCQNSQACCDDGPWSVGGAGKWSSRASTVESVRRAIRSLQRKGLVTVSWTSDEIEFDPPYRPHLYRRIWLTDAGRIVKKELA